MKQSHTDKGMTTGKTMNCQKCNQMNIVRYESGDTFFKDFKWCQKYERCLGPADIPVLPCEDCIAANTHE